MPPASPTADPKLTELLRADPPATVAALPAQAQEQLVRVIAGARRRQAQELVASYDAALRHVPAPVRRLVRKVLAG